MAERIVPKLSPCLLLLVLGHPGLAAGGEKKADASAELFNSGKVLQISIELGNKELDSLRREPRKYVKATLKLGDKIVVKDVGVHVKGAAGSFRHIDDKASLTINMDKFDQETLFFGLDKFHLANSLQDATYIQELLCGEWFRAMGVPAARVAHAVVTINGRRRGLYYLKEGYDRVFLKRWFKNADGNLYDGGFLREIDQPLQLLSTKKDVKNHADLKALAAAAREGNPQVRYQKLDKLLDLDQFLGYMALQVFTWDWDGYPMNRNNYRIYHDPVRDKITFFPSGMDQMFGDPNGPALPAFQGSVSRALIETPEGKKRYIAKMQEVVQKVYQPKQTQARLDELQTRVQAALDRTRQKRRPRLPPPRQPPPPSHPAAGEVDRGATETADEVIEGPCKRPSSTLRYFFSAPLRLRVSYFFSFGCFENDSNTSPTTRSASLPSSRRITASASGASFDMVGS
jgi:hypothetical protein